MFSHRHVYKFCQRNLFFSEVPKVDLTRFGNKLFICKSKLLIVFTFYLVWSSLSLVFLCINDLAPSYLQELLVQYRPSWNLRSQSKSWLVSPRINTQFYGARSFQSSAPELWNNIPDKIKTSKTIDQFKAALKPRYFYVE